MPDTKAEDLSGVTDHELLQRLNDFVHGVAASLSPLIRHRDLCREIAKRNVLFYAVVQREPTSKELPSKCVGCGGELMDMSEKLSGWCPVCDYDC